MTINLSSSDTTEGTVPASLTFTAANFSVAQTVTVTGVDDALDDGNVAYTIATTVTSGDAIYAAINPADVGVTNTDNDAAAITVTPIVWPDDDRGWRHGDLHGGADERADGRRDDQPEPRATPTEGTVPASLTFTAANFSVAQTVTVTGVDDALDDGNVALHDCDHGHQRRPDSMPRSIPPTSP